MNHKMNEIFNVCMINRNNVLKQLSEASNISREDSARDEELREIHQHLFSCNHLFAPDNNQTEPYY